MLFLLHQAFQKGCSNPQGIFAADLFLTVKNKFLVLPLLITCVFFFLFCFILFDLSFRAKLLAFIIFTSISVLSGVFALKYRENLTLLYLCLACIGGILALGSIMVNVDIPALSEYDHIGVHKIEGYFTSVHYSTDYHSAHFARVTKVDGKEARFNTYILFDEKLPENNYKCFTLEVELGSVEDYAELNLSKRSFDARGHCQGYPSLYR